GELVGRDRALLEEQLLGRLRRGACLFDRGAGPVFGHVAKVDENVGDEAAGTAARDRRRQAQRPASVRPQRGRGRVAGFGDRAQVTWVVPALHQQVTGGREASCPCTRRR